MSLTQQVSLGRQVMVLVSSARHTIVWDIYTGTLGKAFGGALGGFTTGRKEIIDMLRQRSRPYLFSNSLAPCIIGASLEVFKMLKESNELHDKLVENVNYFRDKMMSAGFDINQLRVPSVL